MFRCENSQICNKICRKRCKGFEKQKESIEDEEFKITEELESVRNEEQSVLKDITEKYGPGQLDPQTGIFTPSTEVKEPDTE